MNDALEVGAALAQDGTASETSTNAASVPMLTISSSLPIGVSAGDERDDDADDEVSRTGVPEFGLVRPSARRQQAVAATSRR